MNSLVSQPVLDQRTAPLYDSSLAFAAKKQARFFCPGHKGGRTLPLEFRKRIAQLDLNNLPDTDTLHCPTGPILDAERLLSSAYGVAETFMLVGGSTSGNIAALLATLNPGDRILVQRNAHKSVISGLIQSGALPIWLVPQWDERFGLVEIPVKIWTQIRSKSGPPRAVSSHR